MTEKTGMLESYGALADNVLFQQENIYQLFCSGG